jgi:hypothetical protein
VVDDRPLRHLCGGEGQVRLGRAAAAVADVAPDEREAHVLALVQRREGGDAVRRGVVGDEEDGPVVAQRAASS